MGVYRVRNGAGRAFVPRGTPKTSGFRRCGSTANLSPPLFAPFLTKSHKTGTTLFVLSLFHSQTAPATIIKKVYRANAHAMSCSLMPKGYCTPFFVSIARFCVYPSYLFQAPSQSIWMVGV